MTVLARHRIGTDWNALIQRALKGEEDIAVVSAMLFEAAGRKPATDEADVGTTAKALLKLAELLKSPADIKKQIADLDRTAQGNRAAADLVKSEQAKLDKTRQDMAAERAAHEAAIARELKDHQSALAAGHAELASVKEQAADLKAKAEFALATATALKEKLQKKLAVITAD